MTRPAHKRDALLTKTNPPLRNLDIASAQEGLRLLSERLARSVEAAAMGDGAEIGDPPDALLRAVDRIQADLVAGMRMHRPFHKAAQFAPIAPPTIDVLGVPLSVTDYDETMDWIDASIAYGEKGYVCVAATHTIMVCNEDPELREAVLGASMTVPEGQPLVWAMNALGGDLERRVYGPELMARYCERAAENGTRLYLYGGRNQGALVQLALNLRQRFPGVKIVGGYSPPYRDLSEPEEEAIAAEMNASGAEVVWVGVGAPKQEKWMAAMRDRLDAPVLIGVGAAFDFHAGLVAQAPMWMQSAGLEWSFRLAHEPRRLWRRYARYNPRFIAGFTRQYIGHRIALASGIDSASKA